jgi:hypothetical protein
MPQNNKTSYADLRENDVARLKYVNKRVKEYTREGQEDPDQRKWRKSYYRGDQKMAPGDPAMYAPGDQQLRDLYEGSGKYHGYGASALGGSNGSYANQGPISKMLGVRKDKPK